jgi:hypothetical protein
VTLAAHTTPVYDLLLWAHLDFVITLGALLSALVNIWATLRNLRLMTQMRGRLTPDQAPVTPPADPRV